MGCQVKGNTKALLACLDVCSVKFIAFFHCAKPSILKNNKHFKLNIIIRSHQKALHKEIRFQIIHLTSDKQKLFYIFFHTEYRHRLEQFTTKPYQHRRLKTVQAAASNPLPINSITALHPTRFSPPGVLRCIHQDQEFICLRGSQLNKPKSKKVLCCMCQLYHNFYFNVCERLWSATCGTCTTTWGSLIQLFMFFSKSVQTVIQRSRLWKFSCFIVECMYKAHFTKGCKEV